jgi:hypothetical protein
VGDEELSKRIDKIKAGIQDEDLRKELSQTVQNRIAELQRHQETFSQRMTILIRSMART